jgi:hypothetical protein
MPLIPVSIDTGETDGFLKLMDMAQPVDLEATSIPDGWCNFWRQDDWSATAYFYLDSAAGVLPPIAPASYRIAGLEPPAAATEI